MYIEVGHLLEARPRGAGQQPVPEALVEGDAVEECRRSPPPGCVPPRCPRQGLHVAARATARPTVYLSTAGDVAAAINAEAGEDVISGQYIWLLRTGRRDNPTYKHLIAISRFFGVSPLYFFDESEADRGAIPAEVAVALQDDAVRDLALRAAGLSEHSLKAISDMVDSARSLQAQPPTRRARQADDSE